MNILHVIHTLDPQKGGPPMIAARLAAAQASLGNSVGVLYQSDAGADERLAKAVGSIPGFDQVKLHRIEDPHGNFGEIFSQPLADWLKTGLNNYDWLHMHAIWAPIIFQTAKAANQIGKPYVIVPHGMLDPWSLSGQGSFKHFKKKFALLLGYKRMLQGAAYLHLGNADEQNLIGPLGLSTPGVIIPNGVFPQEIETLPAPGSFVAKRPELKGKRYILFLSRLHFKKGLDYLADAFAMVAKKDREVLLVVAGPDDGMQQPMTEQLRAHGVLDRVIFTGPLWGPDKLAAMIDSCCFCLPSRQEGFSLAITEALGCRCPVVISEGCHFPEVAEAGAGWVTPLGAAPTAKALEEALAQSPEAARAMGEKGRNLVLSRFTWPKIAEATIAAYDKHE